MLTNKDIKKLKSLGHPLKAVVQIGKRGFSESLTDECNAALLAHELIKVKCQEAALNDFEKIIAEVCEKTESELVQVKGHVALLYKAHPEDPTVL